ncbi:MAG: phospholipid carrier-dependent glycosyltransferase [Candidatus Daviesbacteria bacterium]|nr:phospholipid carrier-dependent glycosyltransferase [Candidatus Daviesbacteria bacterium]
MKNKKVIISLTLIMIVGAVLRFYKLDWGQGLFTHPDEYYIVISANQLSFPNQMNPHFFNYGTFSIYLNYFTQQLLQLVTLDQQIASSAYNLSPFLIGRFYSALFSTLTIPLIYLISLTFFNKKYSLLAAALVALTPGLIQQAHFLTPESNLIFFIFLSLTFLLYFVKQKKSLFLILSSASLGLALGVKISSAVLFLPILLGIFLASPSASWRTIPKIISRIILSLFIILVTLFIIDPYLFLDFSSFLSSFKYESALAIGTIPVFYTRQFINTVPVLFQFEKIYPYALGPALLVFGIAGFLAMCLSIFRQCHCHPAPLSVIPGLTRDPEYNNLDSCPSVLRPSGSKDFRRNDKNTTLVFLFIILNSTFLILFLSNAFLFAKWTRFISPTFPFFAIFSAFLLFKISQFKINKYFSLILKDHRIASFAYSSFLILTILWTLSYFSIYLKNDVRLQASNWIAQNLTPGTVFLEEGNMVDIPLPENFKRLSLNFYDLDENILSQQKLKEDLEKSDYFIIQSRRIFANHQRLAEDFPVTANFYNQLFADLLEFTEIKEINSYPQLNLLGWKIDFPDEVAEETWSVFDHPVIRIFQKNVK